MIAMLRIDSAAVTCCYLLSEDSRNTSRPQKEGGHPAAGLPRNILFAERCCYCVAIVAANLWSTGPIGFSKEPPEPPAKQSPTGLLPDWVTMSEPESPARMNEAGVMIWPVNVATPVEYPTWIVTLMAWIVPVVRPDVRPDFLTANPTEGDTTDEEAV